jgi:hypothetical protein
MSRRRKPAGEGEVVGGTPPTASSVPVTLIANCYIGGVRRFTGDVVEVEAGLVPVLKHKRVIDDPDNPLPSEFAWLSRP